MEGQETLASVAVAEEMHVWNGTVMQLRVVAMVSRTEAASEHC